MILHSYAGIGSRETPDDILALMTDLGAAFGRLGWVLRSGGAPGADTAFERGAFSVNGPRRIYLPRRAFGPLPRQDDPDAVVPLDDLGALVWREAQTMAETLHPGWEKLTALALRDDAAGRKAAGTLTLLTRNMFQVMGDSLESPVDLVVCYGEKPVLNEHNFCIDVEGGTGQAVRLAAEMHIPTYNLILDSHREAVAAFIADQQAFMAQANANAAAVRRRSP
jgi:hypothetical protein